MTPPYRVHAHVAVLHLFLPASRMVLGSILGVKLAIKILICARVYTKNCEKQVTAFTFFRKFVFSSVDKCGISRKKQAYQTLPLPGRL